MVLRFLFLLLLTLLVINNSFAKIDEGENMEIKSSAFENNGMIPKAYTCDGNDISPPLQWDSIPENTQGLALICDDPDAPIGTWVHWVIYNIRSTPNELPAKILPQEKTPFGAGQGINDFGKIGYGGPCPPSGVHRYFFKLYALDTKLNLEGRVTKKQLEDEIKEHIIDKAELVGRYSRHG